MFKTVMFFVCFLNYSLAQNCKENGTILALKRPNYDFSVSFLDRISYGITDHFVYSPLSTWLQLVTLADGAQRETLQEIFHVAKLKGHKTRVCYRRKLKEIVNKLNDASVARSSVVIIDKFYRFNEIFKIEARAQNSVKLLSLDFDDSENSADRANDLLENNNENLQSSLIIPDNFDNSVLILADLTYFKSAWKHPFNEALTKPDTFYSEKYDILGVVDMMNQVGYFKEAEIPSIDARVLELPFANERISMLIYLPIKREIPISDIYYLLRGTTLTSILKSLNEEKAINVFLPKFSIRTEIENIPELLYDMGLKRVFHPELASLKGITSSGPINVSWMSQMSTIHVIETHVEASSSAAMPENFISDAETEFIANQPFAFMLIDRTTEFILFAGIYSDPNYEQYV